MSRLLLTAALFLAPHGLPAQHASRGAPPPAAAAREATQFDFLVGQWELEVKPKATRLAEKIHGVPRLLGAWKAWKALDGSAVEDELRIMDRSGNPASLTLTLRLWSAGERRWLVHTFDGPRGRVSTSTGTRSGDVVDLRGEGTDAEGKPTMTRTRFSGITPTAFRMTQDRSSDGGRSWDEGVLTIDARRVAAVAPR